MANGHDFCTEDETLHYCLITDDKHTQEQKIENLLRHAKRAMSADACPSVKFIA